MYICCFRPAGRVSKRGTGYDLLQKPLGGVLVATVPAYCQSQPITLLTTSTLPCVLYTSECVVYILAV